MILWTFPVGCHHIIYKVFFFLYSKTTNSYNRENKINLIFRKTTSQKFTDAYRLDAGWYKVNIEFYVCFILHIGKRSTYSS